MSSSPNDRIPRTKVARLAAMFQQKQEDPPPFSKPTARTKVSIVASEPELQEKPLSCGDTQPETNTSTPDQDETQTNAELPKSRDKMLSEAKALSSHSVLVGFSMNLQASVIGTKKDVKQNQRNQNPAYTPKNASPVVNRHVNGKESSESSSVVLSPTSPATSSTDTSPRSQIPPNEPWPSPLTDMDISKSSSSLDAFGSDEENDNDESDDSESTSDLLEIMPDVPVRSVTTPLDKSQIPADFLLAFPVIKFDPNHRMFSKKTRIWEISILEAKLRARTTSGRLCKEHRISNLKHIARRTDNFSLVLRFSGSKHDYTLIFNSANDRELFYQCITLLRRNVFTWCPTLRSLVSPSSGQETSAPMTLSKVDAQEAPTTSTPNNNGDDGERYVVELSDDGNPRMANKKLRVAVSDSRFETFSVFCGTWNMGCALPPAHLEDWIPRNSFDIYALTFQESCSEKEILDIMKQHIGDEYVVVGESTLWEIRTIVFIRKLHTYKLTNVETNTKATGFMNIAGNKGGCVVAFRLNETSFCFIGSHLAAREEKVPQRNSNVGDICDNIKLGNRELDLTQFQHVFWFGDLNYRIDMPFEEGLQIANLGEYWRLMENDQLVTQIAAGNVFQGYQEGDVQFMPTYRYNRGDRTYTKEKCRTPSYCDRVLWRSLPGLPIKNIEYKAPTTITTSDHSPVYATFSVGTQLPYLSVFGQPTTPKMIVFSKLFISGRNGPLVEKPSLSFFGEFFDKSPMHTHKAGKMPKLVNPQFTDASLPQIPLTPALCDTDYLQTQSVIVVVRNLAAKKDSPESIIGYALLSLNDSCGPEPKKFKIMITRSTARVGFLNGQVHVLDRSQAS